jgi:hypothetical protein
VLNLTICFSNEVKAVLIIGFLDFNNQLFIQKKISLCFNRRFRDGWIPNQTRLFGKVTKVLHADQLARLATTEPIQRRLVIDKTAKRLRQIFASVS